tara:strand:- start:24779 stop:25786 length:1008 start_codon:yes stop_codon:yes gene_type:complete
MKTSIIAEIGQAHDGSLGLLHSYIDALAECGVDVIKFQTHIASAESSEFENFRIKFSLEDKTRFDYWKRMEFTKEQWFNIKTHCENLGIEFLSSPFSLAAVELLEEINVKRYKVGSGEVSNFLILEKIAKTKKPILLSSGMSSYDELDAAVAFLESFNSNISIFQCNTEYPTAAENIGLNVVSEMLQRYDYPIGLSDHSGEIYSSLAAVSLGASLIEVHSVFDKKMFGPDTSSSLTINQLSQLVKGIRFIEKSINNPVNKDDTNRFVELKSIFEKSLAVNKNLAKGHVLTFADLESKKPSNRGISAKSYKKVVGKKLLKPLSQWSFISEDDIEYY